MGENRSVHWIKQAGAQKVSKSQGQDSSLLPPAPVSLNPYRPHTHTCTYTVIHLFICFWLLWIFVAARRLSLAVVSRSYSPVAVLGLPILVASLLWSVGSRSVGFCSCRAWASLLCAMRDLPGPGIKPVSPALAGRFLTTWPQEGLLTALFSHSMAWGIPLNMLGSYYKF